MGCGCCNNCSHLEYPSRDSFERTSEGGGDDEVDSKEPLLPPVLTVQVTNVGSKPILVQGIAIQRKKGSEPGYHFSRVKFRRCSRDASTFCRYLIEPVGSQSPQRGCTRGTPVGSTGTWQGRQFVTYSISTIDYHTTLDPRKTKAFDVTRPMFGK